MAFAKNAVADWKCDVTAVVDDSVSALAGLARGIDVLYLDSLDVGEPGYEEHALREIKVAEPNLTDHSIVIFDDTVWERGWRGKGASAVPYLLERGWTVLGAGYQVVMSKKLPTNQ